MRYLLFILITCLFSISCKKQNPSYDFSWSDEPVWGIPVTFYSTAPDNSSFYWRIGNDVFTVAHPKETFGDAGVYTVSLTINNDSKNTVTKQITVGKFATFSYTGSRVPNDTIHFKSYSYTGTDTYLWNFGDGTSSTEANPHHIYQTIGQYKVTCVINGHYNAFCNNPIITIEKDPIYTYKIAGTRMWQIQVRTVGSGVDSITYYPITALNITMTDKLTLFFPYSNTFFPGEVIGYNSSLSKNTTLVYGGGYLKLFYDYVADTARIERIGGNATAPPPFYTYYTTARTQ